MRDKLIDAEGNIVTPQHSFLDAGTKLRRDFNQGCGLLAWLDGLIKQMEYAFTAIQRENAGMYWVLTSEGYSQCEKCGGWSKLPKCPYCVGEYEEED